MFDEKTMENLIAVNPEHYLGEPGLKLLDRQLKVGPYRFDLVFQDRTGARLIVEIQKGTLDRDHTYRILDYYDEYKDRHPEEFVEIMVVANVIPPERKQRLASKGISYREIAPAEFINGPANPIDSSAAPSPHRKQIPSGGISGAISATSGFRDSDFALFLDQQEKFANALRTYDPTIWFPPLRGGFEEDVPGNWFICFVPVIWGRWKGNYGVHFDLIYARPKTKLPARFRLVIGIESPLKEEYRQGFKKEVITEVARKRIDCSGFILRALNRKKLLEADPIPFGSESWRLALDRYIALLPIVDVIGEVIRHYVNQRAFDSLVEFA